MKQVKFIQETGTLTLITSEGKTATATITNHVAELSNENAELFLRHVAGVSEETDSAGDQSPSTDDLPTKPAGNKPKDKK